MDKVKKPKETKADLRRKLMETEAQIASQAHYASLELDAASDKHLMASAVVLTITALGGRQLVRPVAIRNGISQATVAALKADLKRSFDRATEFKPVV